MANKVGAPEGNLSGLKHGGEGAVKAIQRGEPLRGPAREAELQVYEELETQGRSHLVRRGAVRLEAAAALYWAAIARLVESVGEGEPGDVLILKLDKYVKRFGWLQGAALRAWEQMRQEEERAGDVATDYELMLEQEGD